MLVTVMRPKVPRPRGQFSKHKNGSSVGGPWERFLLNMCYLLAYLHVPDICMICKITLYTYFVIFFTRTSTLKNVGNVLCQFNCESWPRISGL